MSALWSLSGEERTLRGHRISVAIDPAWTSRAADRYDTDEPLLGPEGIARLIAA